MKKEALITFGKTLVENEKMANRTSLKTIKIMRGWEENYNPMEIIINNMGGPLTNQMQVLEQ